MRGRGDDHQREQKDGPARGPRAVAGEPVPVGLCAGAQSDEPAPREPCAAVARDRGRRGVLDEKSRADARTAGDLPHADTVRSVRLEEENRPEENMTDFGNPAAFPKSEHPSAPEMHSGAFSAHKNAPGCIQITALAGFGASGGI